MGIALPSFIASMADAMALATVIDQPNLSMNHLETGHIQSLGSSRGVVVGVLGALAPSHLLNRFMMSTNWKVC